MAKTSAIQKNLKRIKLVKKYAKKRAELKKIGLEVTKDSFSGPNFISAKLPPNTNRNILKQLSEKNIFLSERGGSVRITSHLWNNKNDFDRLIFELKKIL